MLIYMLQRFQELKEVLPRVLEELGTKDSYPNESELEVLDNITKVLEVVEVGAQALGRRDCNLAKADKIFDFVLDNLVELGDPFHFAEKLKVRINERREPLLSGLFILLENPVNYGKTEKTFLSTYQLFIFFYQLNESVSLNLI